MPGPASSCPRQDIHQGCRLLYVTDRKHVVNWHGTETCSESVRDHDFRKLKVRKESSAGGSGDGADGSQRGELDECCNAFPQSLQSSSRRLTPGGRRFRKPGRKLSLHPRTHGAKRKDSASDPHERFSTGDHPPYGDI